MADRDDEKTYTVMDWLGLRDAPRWGLAQPLGILISVVMPLLWAFALAAAVSVLKGSFSEGNTGLGAGGLIVALLGAPFLIWSTVIKHNTLAVSRQTLALSETALFNDKVNAALGGLYSRRQITRVITVAGEDKVLTEWEDDIVQRNGAIDRLEGLANERPSEVPRIANMLSVYVRELSNETYPERSPMQHLRNWAQGLPPFRTDVEKATQTLGRLMDIPGVSLGAITIDLRGAILQGFDLNGLCFAKANLESAWLEGANLFQARMQGANLYQASVGGAHLYEARMEGADLGEARMREVNLSGVRMDSYTDLMNTIFSMAAVAKVDFSDVPISVDQINSMFGDASVILPNGVTSTHPDWPPHWPKFELGDDFDTEWEKWKAEPAAYVPPVMPDLND